MRKILIVLIACLVLAGCTWFGYVKQVPQMPGNTWTAPKPTGGFGVIMLYCLGALTVLGTAAALYLTRDGRLGFIGGLTAAAFFVTARMFELYSWILLILAPVGAIFVGYLIYLAWRGKNFSTALGVIVPEIEKQGEAAKALKKGIEEASGKDAKVVDSVVQKIVAQ